MHWNGSAGAYRLLWATVVVTCTDRGVTQCTQWTVEPLSDAELLKVVGSKKAQILFHSLGFFSMPFRMELDAL
jgi:hypothetical protein